jgi:single-strand DNA-binding protein
MADYNCVVLLGRLATNHHYTKSDGQKAQSVTFVDVVAWRRLGEICSQFLKKGRQVLISGSLKQERWTDAKTQKPRSRLKVLAREVKFVGPKPDGEPDDPKDLEAETPEREAAEA